MLMVTIIFTINKITPYILIVIIIKPIVIVYILMIINLYILMIINLYILMIINFRVYYIWVLPLSN